MKKEDKDKVIDALVEEINASSHFYLADISGFNVATVNRLRGICFKRNVTLKVVKNTLLQKALQKTGRDYENLYDTLHGSTSIMFSETGNVPAVIIQEFRKTNPKPLLKGAYVQECVYVGDNNLLALVNVKSRNELIADIIYSLQAPIKGVVSGLQASGGNKIAGLVKTLSEK